MQMYVVQRVGLPLIEQWPTFPLRATSEFEPFSGFVGVAFWSFVNEETGDCAGDEPRLIKETGSVHVVSER
jgi:hypothetical protein